MLEICAFFQCDAVNVWKLFIFLLDDKFVNEKKFNLVIYEFVFFLMA